jgi:hypothetical protein
MAFNGTGTFVRFYNWATDKINSVPITASRMDTEIDGIATGLSNCLTKDGQTTVTANIPMASHKFTGLSVGNARTDSLTLGQVQDGQFTALGLTGGAADAYTATPSPAIAAYVATMQYSAKIHATNLTTTPTLLISAISGGTIKKLDASKAEVEVEASDMLVNGFYNFKRNVANDAWILLNPEKAYYNLTNSTAATESVAGIAILPKAKDKKKAEIKALRDNNLLLPTPLTIELSGLNKQFNIKSVDLLMFGTIIAVLSQSEGSTRSWQAGDGVRYELTVNDYRSLVNHLISRDELEFFQAKLKIAALSLLNTVEEIEAFDINEIIIS